MLGVRKCLTTSCQGRIQDFFWGGATNLKKIHFSLTYLYLSRI